MPSALNEWLLHPVSLGILGLLIGSFLNVVVHRMPQMLERAWLRDVADILQDPSVLRRALGEQTKDLNLADAGKLLGDRLDGLPSLGLSTPRSRCPHCGHLIRWYENVPVISWLVLRGRCAHCKQGISLRYPVVEAFTGLLFAAISVHFGPSTTTAVYCLAAAVMLAGALIDLDTTLLPDDLTLPLIAIGLVAAWMGWTPLSLQDAALGALFGYLSLWSVSFAYKLLRGRVGMAEGDFKLLSGLGALLGWQALVPIILMSSLVGAVVGVSLIVFRKHDREVPIPFGPYLAGGGLVVMLFGASKLMRALGG